MNAKEEQKQNGVEAVDESRDQVLKNDEGDEMQVFN